MFSLKKTVVAVLAIGSSAVFAGSMGPVCMPGAVTVPCASRAWDFGAQALYLKPSYSNYNFDSYTRNPSQTAGYSLNKTPNDWGWGFKLEGSYHFNTGNDLNLNWYWFDHTVTSNTSNAYVLGGSSLLLNKTYPVLNASAKTQWDAVNLEFGQHAHFGEWKNIRFHGGVQYGYINNTVDLNGVAGTRADTESTQTKYSGFGPRIGADYWYNWGNGIAMYANGASALLVGNRSFNETYTNLTIGTPIVFNTFNGSATTIVPELEGKLGLTYGYAMSQGDLSLDIGWMWVNYFNAVSNLDPLSHAFCPQESDFAVQGPFVGLKWVGNIA